MPVTLESLVYQWLRSLKIRISRSHLKQQLLAHPDYPSLLSITDTLDALGVGNAAMIIEKDRLQEIPPPYIVHTGPKDNEFQLVKKLKAFEKKNPRFMHNWNGVILVAEAPQHPVKNTEQYIKEKKRKTLTLAIVLSLLTLSASFTAKLPLGDIYLFLTTILGLSISFILVQQELGRSSSIIDSLCRLNKNADCQAVLSSRASHISGWLNLSDLSLVYFFSIWVLLTVSYITNTIADTKVMLAVLSCLTIPVTFYSIYYQASVIKKYCIFCMLIIGILWGHMFILFPLLSHIGPFPLSQLQITIFLLLLTLSAWAIVIRPALTNLNKLEELNFSLLRFKKNREIFTTLLQLQPAVDTTPFEDEFYLGSPNAALQLIVACSLQCKPCARFHQALHRLLEDHEARIGLTIRFAADARNSRNSSFTQHLLQYWKDHKDSLADEDRPGFARRLLYDAYKGIEYFSDKYPLPASFTQGRLLQRHNDWFQKHQVIYTPSVFINGHALPKMYDLSDLPDLLNYLKD